MQVKDLTIEELKLLIQETVAETLESLLLDLEQGKELKPEVKQQLLDFLMQTKNGERSNLAEEVAKNLIKVYANKVIEPTSKFLNYSASILEVPAKIVGGLIALVAIGGFLFPKYIWNPIESWIAEHRGTSGWVYYEVGKDKDGDRVLTKDGNLYLLKYSKGLYNDIEKGDKLRAADAVYFRESTTNQSSAMFHLNANDCVIVISDPENPHKGPFKDQDPKPISGGWLRVATIPCDLF